MERTTRAKRYDDEFKKEAVALLTAPGAKLKAVAKGLGLSAFTLRTWRDKIVGTPEAPLALIPLELERENRRLRAELASMTNQRDILKKACGILSDEPSRGMRA